MGLLAATIITCSQLDGIKKEISSKVNLTWQQKFELVKILRNYTKCPIKIVKK